MTTPRQPKPDKPEGYEFTDDVQRKIIAQAVRGDLLTLTSVFRSEFFAVGSGDTPAPRQRLAEALEKYRTQFPTDIPGNSSMDQLVRDLCARLPSKAERAAVQQEWKAIRALRITDPHYVTEICRSFAIDAAMTRAVFRTADVIDDARARGTQPDAAAIRQLFADAEQVGMPSNDRTMFLLRDTEERVTWWANPLVESHIPTGLTTLDACLNGGPMLEEVFYFLGPPKGSKTTALLNAMLGASRAGFAGLYCSYEMAFLRMALRMDRNLTQMTPAELRLNPSMLRTVVGGMRARGAGEVVIRQFDTRRHGVAEAAQMIDHLRGEGVEIKVVVLDYLNLMSSTTNERERRHQLANISREMYQLSREKHVMVWSAANVRREAVNYPVVTKTDIGEAFEVVAVGDGFVAICGDEEMQARGERNLFLTGVREAEDEKLAGTYEVDRDRMFFYDITDERALDDADSLEDDDA